MTSENIARDVLWPQDKNILVRVVFLYVGQGASTIAFFADGENYKTMLIDINLDSKNGGIDVPRLMADLVGDDGLHVFVNTHPHDDHLCGVIELSDKVSIEEVWHSGHIPGKKYEAAYNNLQEVIKRAKDSGGLEVRLQGSRDKKQLPRFSPKNPGFDPSGAIPIGPR